MHLFFYLLFFFSILISTSLWLYTSTLLLFLFWTVLIYLFSLIPVCYFIFFLFILNFYFIFLFHVPIGSPIFFSFYPWNLYSISLVQKKIIFINKITNDKIFHVTYRRKTRMNWGTKILFIRNFFLHTCKSDVNLSELNGSVSKMRTRERICREES